MNFHRDYQERILRKLYYISENVCFDVFSTRDQKKLKYTHFDTETRVVFVPGIWYPREAYYNLACLLSAKFNVIAYNPRGTRPSEGEFNLALMTDDIIDNFIVFRDIIKAEKMFVVGHSLDAYLSIIAFAKRNNDIVNGLIWLLRCPPKKKLSIMSNGGARD